MQRRYRWMIMVSTSLLAAQSWADPAVHVLSPKRQLIACMTKRMTASRTLSYNEASKVCKAELAPQSVSLTSSVLAKPVTGIAQ